MEGLGVGNGAQLGAHIGQDADRAAKDAEVGQSLEGPQRIAVELAPVIDAGQARAVDHVVRQDFIPQLDDFTALGEEPMPADVEQEFAVPDGAADAAHIDRVALDDHDVATGLCQ
ncbi:hypothetical protein D3C87_1425040 [compost metagenome]